jgi:hypothetical protein
MFKKLLITLIILVLLFLGVYWFFLRTKSTPVVNTDGTPGNPSFSPINRNPFGNNTGNQIPDTGSLGTSTDIPLQSGEYKVPKLRKISENPVSGLAASTTASTSLVRFMDRGTGHVYEANDLSPNVVRISNTTLPKIYESYWNGNGTASVLRYLKDDTDITTNFYAELRKTSSSTSLVPFEIKGKFLSPDIKEVAVSPAGSKIFTWNIEGGRGVGYISNFNEDLKTKILDIPLNQVNIDWPETNTITITTKGSGISNGFIYAVDVKTGVMKKLLNTLTRGLSARVSRDASKIIYSVTSGSSILTSLTNLKDNTAQEVVFRTLADKCVWSNLRKNEVYCAVPTEIPDALYPDAWYRGSVSFVDQIWYLDTETGEVHLIANPLSLANELVDATNLTLDNKDNFLYFINKRDLSLWALDLNQ